jgi:putative membrane protein
MILPGISGAALLYVLGQYEFMIATLQTFLDQVAGLALGGPVDPLYAPGLVILIFLAGVGLGLVTVARAVRWALAADRETTLTLLVSLMVGALRLPASEVQTAIPELSPTTLWPSVVAGLLGVIAILVLDRFTDDLDY